MLVQPTKRNGSWKYIIGNGTVRFETTREPNKNGCGSKKSTNSKFIKK